MRSLAEFAMRGRYQAIACAVIAVASTYFYWVGLAILALVTICKGAKEGLINLVWCLIPAFGLWFYFNEVSALSTLPGVFFASLALRQWQSWRAVLFCTMASGLFSALLLIGFAEAYLADIVEFYQSTLQSLSANLAQQGQEQQLLINAGNVTPALVAGIFGAIAAFAATISVIIARWWQATLYNPKGFQQEFHRIRFSPWQSLGLLASAIILSRFGSGFTAWSAIAVIPLFFAGIALVHGAVAKKQWSGHVIGMFYVLLIIIDQFKLLVVVLAVIDSLVDFRSRIKTEPPQA